MTKYLFLFALIIASFTGQAQIDSSSLVTYEQFLQYVYQHHPLAEGIRLKRLQAEQYIQKAKSGFDPKLSANWDLKQFDQKAYFSILNAQLKVPIWSSIEVQAGYDYVNGIYLNNERAIPTPGQAYLGIKLPLLNGLWTNERRTMVQQANVKLASSEVEIQLLLNDLLYDAAKTYWDWVKVYNELVVVQRALETAEEQLAGTRNAYLAGDMPAIDTLKAFIQVQERQVLLGTTQLEVVNAARLASTFLWTADQQPQELTAEAVPVNLAPLDAQPIADDIFERSLSQIDDHPSLQYYDFQQDILSLNQRLYNNKLLPKLDAKYNFLSTEHIDFVGNSGLFTPVENFKFGLQFSMPLFLRKERADLAMVKFKQRETTWKQDAKRRDLVAKINNYFNEVQLLAQQAGTLEQMVSNYSTLLDVERIKLDVGESSIFMVNTRENQLLDAQIKLIKQQISYLKARTGFFWITAVLPTN